MMLTWFPPRVQPREGWTRVVRVRGPVLKLLKILRWAAFQNEIQVAVLSPFVASQRLSKFSGGA